MAEILIVIAIIGVLTAIAFPLFNSQLEKSREATDLANIRVAYSSVMTNAVTDESGTYTETVTLKQQGNGWDTAGAEETLNQLTKNHVTGTPQKGGSAKVSWENGVLSIVFEGALPVTFNDDDLSNPVVMSERYGQISSYLLKNFSMPKMRTRYDYCGEGATDAEKVKIYTEQTGDGQTINEIKDKMRELGYSDKEISGLFAANRYAYLDEDGNLLGYHGAGSGGQSKLYIVGYDNNPVSVGGAVEARNTLAKYVQTGSPN